MTHWTPFPLPTSYQHTPAGLQRLWPRLHAGDKEPWPADPAVLAAWQLFHAGDFQAATEAGLQAGGGGITVANKAQAQYATYLEPHEATRLRLFLDVADRARAQLALNPDLPNAHHLLACALGRYAQTLSVASALAQGLGPQIRTALEHTLRCQPEHVDARIALGLFQAEVIDTLGEQAALALGAEHHTALALFDQALQLQPDSAIGRLEYARALVLLRGAAAVPEATRLFEQVAQHTALDATEHLVVAMAQAELDDNG